MSEDGLATGIQPFKAGDAVTWLSLDQCQLKGDRDRQSACISAHGPGPFTVKWVYMICEQAVVVIKDQHGHEAHLPPRQLVPAR